MVELGGDVGEAHEALVFVVMSGLLDQLAQLVAQHSGRHGEVGVGCTNRRRVRVQSSKDTGTQDTTTEHSHNAACTADQ